MAPNAVVLLSGGLDSALNLAMCKDKIAIALTIDYGQLAAKREIQAAQELTKYYQKEHRVLKFDFLKDLTAGALLGHQEVPTMTEQQLQNDMNYQQQTAAKVWVPNRNGLFINIAACLAEAQELNEILVGFNAEEAQTFPDNTSQFIEAVNSALAFSTQNHVKVVCETIHMSKNEMVEKALEIRLPLNKIWSCYHGKDEPCQSCESCMRFQRAYRTVTGEDYAY